MLLLAPKDPNEVIFYDFNWARNRLLPGEVITSSGWEISGGTVEVCDSPAPTFVDGVCRVYVRGGQLGEVNILTNFVTTSLNPRRDFSGKLKIKAK